MKIEMIIDGMKSIKHLKASGMEEIKKKAKPGPESMTETIAYVEKYINENGFELFSTEHSNTLMYILTKK